MRPTSNARVNLLAAALILLLSAAHSLAQVSLDADDSSTGAVVPSAGETALAPSLTDEAALGGEAEPDGSDAREASLRAIREHAPGKGVKLVGGAWGQVDFSLYTAIRYLNQRGLEETYTDSTGLTKEIDRRTDLQFQKVLLYFKGWLGVPEFRYLTYVWTSNASQGLGAQVVVAGNLTYRFNEYISLGAGIGGLPTTRSVRGNFPFWLKHDSRTIADEYFRGSYTSGLWAWGDLAEGLHYRAMWGNNLSQLGIDAGQLDMGMDTYSAALWWTTKNFGAYEGFGDFEQHDDIAASVGGAYTQSREDKQSQPGTEDPENSQLRVSDGRLIFFPGAFAPGAQIERATYRMAAFDGGLKYQGFSLEGEYFLRRLDSFDVRGELPFDRLRDHGFQLQASAMLIPRTLMLYASGSKIYGDFGNPWDVGIGLNYYPFGNKVLRVNGEVILVDKSPVGNLSSPLLVGADGTVFVANVELYF